jgi:hypothetical protein
MCLCTFFSLCGLCCGLTTATSFEGVNGTSPLEADCLFAATSAGDNFIFLSTTQKRKIKNTNYRMFR